MNQEKIGNLIKQLRKEHHLTQKELADKLGVTYQAVSKWENGKNIPDIAILNLISEEFHLDIDSIVKGTIPKKKKNYWILLIFVLVIFFFFGIYFLFFHSDNFEFKKISSMCTDFKITGSIAYNNDKSSLYISNVEFCGEEDATVYKKIECTLNEEYENTKTKISSCENMHDENISLQEYLKTVSIEVSNYSSICKQFSDSSLYLEINSYLENDQIHAYKIPLSFEENCN